MSSVIATGSPHRPPNILLSTTSHLESLGVNMRFWLPIVHKRPQPYIYGWQPEWFIYAFPHHELQWTMNKSQQMVIMDKFSSSDSLVQERKPLENLSPSIAQTPILNPLHNTRTQRWERVTKLLGPNAFASSPLIKLHRIVRHLRGLKNSITSHIKWAILIRNVYFEHGIQNTDIIW